MRIVDHVDGFKHWNTYADGYHIKIHECPQSPSDDLINQQIRNVYNDLSWDNDILQYLHDVDKQMLDGPVVRWTRWDGSCPNGRNRFRGDVVVVTPGQGFRRSHLMRVRCFSDFAAQIRMRLTPPSRPRPKPKPLEAEWGDD